MGLAHMPRGGTILIVRRSWRLGIAVVVPFTFGAALVPLRSHVDATNLALLFVLVVLGTAVFGGQSAGVVAALSSATAFDLFLTQPYSSLRIRSSADVETTVLLVAVGVVAGTLVERARRAGAAAAAAAAELASTHRRAELAASGEPAARLISVTVAELTQLLELKSCRYVDGPPSKAMAEFTHQAIRVPAGHAPRGMASLPVRAHGSTRGHIVMVFADGSVGTRLAPEQRHAAVAIADQLGMALLRPSSS